MFFKRFYEYETKLREFRIELDALKSALDDVRAERDEFKRILFRKFGLIETDVPRDDRTFQPIQRRVPVARVLADLEARDKIWAKKAEEAEKKLEETSTELHD